MKNVLLAERLEDVPSHRLKSRKPAKDLRRSRFETGKCWRNECTKSTIPNNKLVSDSSNQGAMGMELPRYEWFVLNRLRISQGYCADMMHKY